jgi:CheY-like chemotaxis protein/predicted alpha/beta hydrolase family esterase
MRYLVLFIHGLTGDSTTFEDFIKLLNQDSELKPSVTADQWNYPTNWSSFPYYKTNPRIQDLADSLRTELDHREESSIVLVCHSLGGIIARRMLLDNVKRKLPSKIKHLFLYATPNEGSDLANLAKSISIWQTQLKQLTPSSDFLDSLNNDWHFEKMEHRLGITYVVGALDSIVPIRSATGFWGNERVRTIPNGDHSNVIKPNSLNDIRYKIFQKVMKGILELKENIIPIRKKELAQHLQLKCIIVDDDLMSRISLQRHCAQHKDLELLGVFENATSALDYLANNEVDLIWLDVEMPNINGFELLEKLTYIPFVILTTIKTEYAFDAFQYQVSDYLKKPINLPRFNIAVEKILELNNYKKSLS